MGVEPEFSEEIRRLYLGAAFGVKGMELSPAGRIA